MIIGDQAVMETQADLRATGIEPIGNVPWGSHFCQFYRTPQDLTEILLPYFQAGLASNEYCMWVTSEPLDAGQATTAIRQAMPEFERYLDRGQIEILPYQEWYLQGGTFDAQRVLQGWVDRLDRARARGYDGLRLTGNTFWLEPGAWDSFTEYEQLINSTIRQYSMIALCTYSLDKCSIHEVLDVIRNHEFALVKEGGEWCLFESGDRRKAMQEINRLNTDLERRAAELEAANHELESFSYSVSHDLRTPLHGIRNLIHVLVNDFAAELSPSVRHLVELILANTDETIALVNDLLNFSRYSRQPLKKQRVDMAALVQHVLDELSPLQRGRRIDFTTRDLPACHADPTLLKQVLVNLLTNASKFTRVRAIARVEIGSFERDGETVYYVRDNGVGFDAENTPRLFGVFQRFHAEEDYEGTGVGLAIVDRIIHRHGGRVWAESKIEEGATFYFTVGNQ